MQVLRPFHWTDRSWWVHNDIAENYPGLKHSLEPEVTRSKRTFTATCKTPSDKPSENSPPYLPWPWCRGTIRTRPSPRARGPGGHRHWRPRTCPGPLGSHHEAERGGYKPRAVGDTILGRVARDAGRVFLDRMEISEAEFRCFHRLTTSQSAADAMFDQPRNLAKSVTVE